MEYVEKVHVKVRIQAVIYIPNRVLIGICFPEGDIGMSVKYPHITLFLQYQYSMDYSNIIIKATLNDKDKFKEEYDRVKDPYSEHTMSCKKCIIYIINQSNFKVEQLDAYFITFDSKTHFDLEMQTKKCFDNTWDVFQ